MKKDDQAGWRQTNRLVELANPLYLGVKESTPEMCTCECLVAQVRCELK